MVSIRQRLLHVEDDFLSAIANGTSAIESFYQTWNALLLDIEIAVQSAGLSDELISLAHQTSSRVATLAEGLHQLFLVNEHLTCSMVSELETIMSEVVIQDVHPSNEDHRRCLWSPPSSPGRAARVDLFNTVSASAWLVANLHNPYPSSSVKNAIAKECKMALAVVSTWFEEVREQIGWTALCREEFGGSREAMIEMAFDAYVRDDRLSISSDLMNRFIDIKSNASRLLHEATGVTRNCSRRIPEDSCVTWYGSSPDAREPSLVSWSSSDESEGDVQSMDPMIGYKRSISLCHDRDTAYDDALGQRPVKRLRTKASSPSGIPFQFSSLAKSSSTEDTDLTSPNVSISTTCLPPSYSPGPVFQATELSHEVFKPSFCRRKRRLSDACDQTIPKRPRGVPVGPRLHAVSDPTPFISREDWVFDDWLEPNFNMPETASISELDLSAPLDIEVYNGWISDTGTVSEVVTLDTVGTVRPTEQLDLPADFDLRSIVPEAWDPPAFTFSADGDLDDLVKIANAGFAGKKTNVEIPLIPLVNEGSLQGDEFLSTPQNSVTNTNGSFDSLAQLPEQSTGVDVAGPCANSSNPEFSLSGTDPSHLLQSMMNCVCRSPPPSFSESIGNECLQWDQFWDPFAHLPEIGTIAPPPPYLYSPEISDFRKSPLMEAPTCEADPQVPAFEASDAPSPAHNPQGADALLEKHTNSKTLKFVKEDVRKLEVCTSVS